jgi:anti-sigma B factor antagonist
MNIEKKLDGGKLSLKVIGRLDTNTSPELEAEMTLDGVNEVLFDLSELEYVSSAGLRVFLTAQKAMMACGGQMTIANPNATVKGVFDITGCSDIFTIV